MNILHIEAGKHLYGGARQVQYLCEGLNAKGVNNVLLCPAQSDIAKACHSSAKVIEVKWGGDLDFGCINRIKTAIKDNAIDLVHCHSRRGADWFGPIAAKLCNVPCVISRRVDNPESTLVTKLKYGLVDSVVSISRGIGDVLLQQALPKEKLTVIPSAVDTQSYERCYHRQDMLDAFNLPEDSIVLAQIAQLIKRKGHECALNAFKAISTEFPNAYLVVLGKGPLKEEIAQQIDQLGLNDRVRMAGFRTDLPKLIGNFDVVVHPAFMEGLGVSLLQAGAAGVAMIGGNAGGIPEIIINNKTGILVEPGDEAALVKAMQRLLSSKDMREQFGNAAKTHINDHFSIRQMVDGNLSNYRKLLSQ